MKKHYSVMRRPYFLFVSTALSLLFPFAANSQVETSSHKVLGNSCVNLRAKPFIKAPVLKCLTSGSNVQIVRIPPTGRFIWVNDQAGHTWFSAMLPGTSAAGWILPECTDLYSDTNKKPCTDYGSTSKSRHLQSNLLLAQSFVEETLHNTSWKVVPGARVSRNPADTLIDVNNIDKKGAIVTFDITGYQSFYYRL